MGIFAVGGMIGGLASGKAADWVGRKGAMLLNNAIALLAAVLMTAAYYVNMYPLLIIGRLVIGVNAGQFHLLIITGMLHQVIEETGGKSVHDMVVKFKFLVRHLTVMQFLRLA